MATFVRRAAKQKTLFIMFHPLHGLRTVAHAGLPWPSETVRLATDIMRMVQFCNSE